MKNNIIIVVATIMILAGSLSGCLENPNKNDDVNSNLKFEEIILGNWTKIEQVGNYTYKIVYKFFSNLSFFSGIWESNSETYDMSLWGIYSINDEKLYLNVEEMYPSNSVHKYYFSDKGESLIFYYSFVKTSKFI